MKSERTAPGPCLEAREALREVWIDGGVRGAVPGALAGSPAAAHLAECADCRSAADDMALLDRQIAMGFLHLGSLVVEPSKERIDDVMRRIREEEGDAKLIRKIRRPIRILLWILFYSFTLLACLLLAVAVYKART